MPLINKPQNINKIWSNSGDRATPSDQKINQGWVPEIPPHQWFNYIDNKQDQAIAHINQMGIPQWDAVTEYQANKSYAQGPTNGVVYKATQTHTNQNPEVSSGYWEVAFLTQAPDYDTTYVRLNQNLADLPNKTQARNNLSVLSAAETNALVNTSLKTSNFSGSNQQLASTGYQKLPGGLIMQWGGPIGGTGTPASTSIVFPIPFPTECFQVSLTQLGATTAQDGHHTLVSYTRTGATMRRSWTAAELLWFAIGR